MIVPMNHENKIAENKGKAAKKPSQKKPKVPKKISERYLYNSGTYYLQRFTASSAHFRKVMIRKIDKSCYYHKEQNREDCIKILDKIIEEFRSLGFLNDDAYTRGSVTSLRRRGMSEKIIVMRLQQKGIPSSLIKKHLTLIDGEYGSNSEFQAALRLARKKRIGPFNTVNIRGTGKENVEKQRNKAIGTLARAGFSYDIVSKVMELSHEDAIDIIEA